MLAHVLVVCCIIQAGRWGMELSEAARQMALARPRHKHICLTCGKEFEARGKARYCSGLCRWQAWDQRKKARLTPVVEEGARGAEQREQTE